MAKAIDSSKHILAGLLLLSFLLLVLVATRWIQNSSIHTVKEEKTEGFKTAPTRAADCKCLPGYVPSKQTRSKYGGRFLSHNYNILYYNPDNTKILHWVPMCELCGIKTCDEGILVHDISNYSMSNKMFSCDIVNKYTQASNLYKCQNLSDPSDIKSCY